MVSKMKEDILNAGTKYQIGGLHNHRVEEYLIVVKALIGRSTQVRDGGVILVLVDKEIFFILKTSEAL